MSIFEASPDTTVNSRNEPPSWHALAASEALSGLDTDWQQGLGRPAAEERLARLGLNVIPEKPPTPPLVIFVSQFKSLLILILVVAAVLAAIIGELRDAAVIMVVTMLNAVLGFVQEFRAEKSLAGLRRMMAQNATVRREGAVMEVPSREIAQGDIVLLTTGSRVPADGRVLAGEGLEIDESALTGESVPVAKDGETVLEPDTGLADRINLAYMNTMVTHGRGEMVVIATGKDTEIGRLAQALGEAEEPPTPLQIQLDALGKRLSLVAGVAIAFILALNLGAGRGWAESVLETIALAVAAVPEGLPAVVTITLALGMQRMAKNHAIVKRLAAVETLGSTSVICSDKTGTLTLNQMRVQALSFRGLRYDVTDEQGGSQGEIQPGGGAGNHDLTPLLQPLVLCNDSRLEDGMVIGDPMEGALLVLGKMGGLEQTAEMERLPRVAEIPFDSRRKFMVTFHAEGDQVRVFAKGAAEALLECSGTILVEDGAKPMADGLREQFAAEIGVLAGQQLRVLAVAFRTLPRASFDASGELIDYVTGMTLTGLVGLMDPPRPEVPEAINRCHHAGVEVKMVTGDHPETALAIARRLGLEGEVIAGKELERIDAADLAGRMERTAVLARVTPADKVKIVEALRNRGRVVAMTGDGVNDAPALKSAHIGVAMGKSGTDVAKEAAAMILTDDNFATIVGAIEEGRTIYDNIVKFVRFQLSTNVGAILSMLTASLLGWPPPFNPIQILWVNIIMDGPPAIAMGLEPSRPRIMHEPPRRPEAQILSWRRLGTISAFGTVMMLGTLGVYFHAVNFGRPEAAPTLAFTAFVLFQMFNAFNARVEGGSAFGTGFFANRPLWLSLIGLVCFQVFVVQWTPAQAIFRTVDLTLGEWALSAGVAASVLVYGELHRGAEALLRKLQGRAAAGRD